MDRLHFRILLQQIFLVSVLAIASGCTTLSWTRQSMIGVYEFPLSTCSQKVSYPAKLSSENETLAQPKGQLRCGNSKLYHHTTRSSQQAENAVVSVVTGERCRIVVAVILGREDSDEAYAKSRLESGEAGATKIAQLFADQSHLSLVSGAPHSSLVNSPLDRNPKNPLCLAIK